MIVRHAIVRAVGAHRVTLEPTGACEGCTCAGRCAFGSAARIDLPLELFARVPAVGTPVSLAIDEMQLRTLVNGWFGRMLAGLIVGATVGAGLASLFPGPIEWIVGAGAAAGTLVAFRRSQQVIRATAPRIETRIENETPRP